MISLILLPGMDGTGRLLDPFVCVMKTAFDLHVVRYPADASMGYPELVDRVKAVLPKNTPFFILGESFSGPVAISLAAAGHPFLKGLVLCCTFAKSPFPILSRLRSAVRIPSLSPMMVRLLIRIQLGRFSTPAMKKMIMAVLPEVSPELLEARIKSILAVDQTPALSGIKVPVLYLQAAKDRLVSAAAGKEVLRCCPHAILKQIDAPHFMLETMPVQAGRIIRTFVHEVMEHSDAVSFFPDGASPPVSG